MLAPLLVNFAFGDVLKVALMVNSMSAILSAGTKSCCCSGPITPSCPPSFVVKDNVREPLAHNRCSHLRLGYLRALAYTLERTTFSGFSAGRGRGHCLLLVPHGFFASGSSSNEKTAPRRNDPISTKY
ncbi:hypothetical protein [Duncaniella dubosii]|uniref:hypothetical protein n=1 Tax=Duncaniella dubosii TaxID=2518971 RepID=UPI003F6812E3